MSSEFAYNLEVKKSTLSRLVIGVESGLVLLLCAFYPMPSVWWLLLFPVLGWFFFQASYKWFLPKIAGSLLLSSEGELRWQESDLPPGSIHASSLISQYGVLLRWQDAANHLHQRWLFCDTFKRNDFRALCRVCRVAKWQKMTDSGT